MEKFREPMASESFPYGKSYALKKIFRMVRFTLFCFFLSLIQVMALDVYSQQTRLSLNEHGQRLEDVLKIIEDKTDFFFMYNRDLINVDKKVDIVAINQKINEILDQLLKGTDIHYFVNNRQIILSNLESDSELKTQQQKSVSGRVTDSSGAPLPGVTIRVKGTTKGTITDVDGKYSLLSVPADATLQISFVGMKTQEVFVSNRTTINVVMLEETIGIDEVVAIGYGSQKKRDITGAVSTVSSNEINKIPVAGIDQALQGQVAGVVVTQNYGAPGAGVQVRIRGIGTIGDSDPLYIIDGVPTKEGINNLNTNDIESISILKDASSAAIYGARAANGVVLITTKQGKEGVTQINFDGQYGISEVTKKLDLLDASQYAQICNEALVNDGKPAVWKNTNIGAGTNWQDVIFRPAPFQKYDFSVNSGNDKTKFIFGLGYFNQAGVVKFSDFSRYNLRFNLNSKVSNKLTIGTNLSLSSIDEDLIDTEINGVVRAALFMPPTVKVYNADGSYAGPGANEGDAQNPLGMAARSNMTLKHNQVFGNLFAEYIILPDLKFKSSLGLNVYTDQTKDFDPTFSEGNANRLINSLKQTDINYSDISWENTLSYSKEFEEKHQFSALAGNTLENSKSVNMYGYREGFVNNDGYIQYLDAGSTNDQARGNLQEWSLASFFGRLNYDFLDKYLVSANIRFDGSSRFGKNNRWGVFPSTSLGWRISKESFFKVPFVDDFKLRASWGQLGNQDIGLYAFSSSLKQYYYVFGRNQTLTPGYAPGADFNPDVKWETTTQKDLGFDISAINNRLFMSADYFVKTTTGMLLQLPEPMTSGFGRTGYENSGSIENKGWEFQASWKDNIGSFKYSIGCNIATLENKVLSLGEMDEPIMEGLFFDLSTRTEVGHSVREFYGYKTDGIFQSQAEIDAYKIQPNAKPGDIRFKNLNNDNVINDKDRTFIGNPYPDFTYGFNANLAYKNMDLSLLFQGQYGNSIYNGTKYWLTNSGTNYNKGTEILNRWNGPNTSNSEPRLTTIDTNQNSRASDRYVEDGSYLRLKELQLGYTLPNSVLDKIGIIKARIYFSGHNLLTFTNYTGYDPEVGAARSGNRTVGFDEVTYPQNRSYILGLNITF